MRAGNTHQGMDEATRRSVGQALGHIPSGLFILTAQHEDRRQGMLTSFVQQVCFEPAMVSVAVAKGRAIMPLISESRRFGLCQLSDQNKLMLRRFASGKTSEDPFLGLDLNESRLGHLPLLAGTLSHLECELACHMDVEGDHDLFVGIIRHGKCNGGNPHVHLREDGFNY